MHSKCSDGRHLLPILEGALQIFRCWEDLEDWSALENKLFSLESDPKLAFNQVYIEG